MTTSNYLEQLQQDKQDLIDNLETQGITDLTGDETFTELVPKVLDIQSGGGSADEYFNINPTSIVFDNTGWLNSNYIKKLDELNVPDTTTSLRYLCYGWNLNKIPKINCNSNITNMAYMFNNCNKVEEIDVTGLNSTNVTDMQYMFYACYNLTEIIGIKQLNLNKVTITSNMFASSNQITSLDMSTTTTSNLTKASSMFSGCNSLINLDITNFDFSKIQGTSSSGVNSIFYGCNSLTNLSFGTNLGKGYTTAANNYYSQLDLSPCTSLTHDSLMSVINNLYDLIGNGKNQQNLVLGSTNMAKLTADEIAIATNKGWNVS